MLPPGLNDEEGVRSRFFVRAWSAAIVFSLLSLSMYCAVGLWSQVALTANLALLGPPLLWWHRRGGPYAALVHVSMALASITFGLSALAQHPADHTSIALLLLVPLLAGLLLGRRGALVWLGVTLGWAALVNTAADLGWLMNFTDPYPTVTHALNFSIGLFLSWLFAATYTEIQATALERLRVAERARSAFLANISHEIRTPMNGVLGMTEVLLQDTLSPVHREQLRVIQRSGRTLVALINDLLDLTKMEAGKLELEEADFNLDRVLADVQALAAPTASSRGVALNFVRAPDVPARLRGDGLRLSQVLTNLVSNAVKFTPQGEVRVEVTRRVDPTRVRCHFSVCDTGVGIAPEVAARLFTAFQQGDSSTTRRYGGTGLGLALSQQLVGLMGGRIALRSEPGQGSCFTFELGFDEAEGPTGEHVVPAPVERGPRLPVLVVDDNPINLKVAMSLVERAGYRAEGATDGRAALEAVRTHDYALVLMDCQMPEMDGFEATERIRGLDGEVRHTPIVALTASAMPDELAACRRVGMNSVLAKPVTFAALQDALQTFARPAVADA